MTVEVPREPQSKWWGHSMTIWGAMITALSTVLPVIGPIVGIDLSPEVIRLIGEQAIAVIQAIGGLVGTLLTIYGRTRASQSIGRRQIRVAI